MSLKNGLILAWLAAGAVHAAEPVPARLIDYERLMKRKPSSDLGVARAWVVETGEVGAMVVRLKGALDWHRHPDGTHRIFVVSGRLKAAFGPLVETVGPGSYLMIPAGMPHRMESVGDEPAVYATVDSPPIDPAKIEWLKPPKR